MSLPEYPGPMPTAVTTPSRRQFERTLRVAPRRTTPRTVGGLHDRVDLLVGEVVALLLQQVENDGSPADRLRERDVQPLDQPAPRRLVDLLGPENNSERGKTEWRKGKDNGKDKTEDGRNDNQFRSVWVKRPLAAPVGRACGQRPQQDTRRMSTNEPMNESMRTRALAEHVPMIRMRSSELVAAPSWTRQICKAMVSCVEIRQWMG